MITSYRVTKFKFLLLSTIFFFSIQSPLIAQEFPDVEYYQQLEALYFELLEDTSTIKQADRIKKKKLNKLDQNRSMIAYNQAMSSACTNVCTPPDLANWQYVGPPVIEIGNVQWNGYVEEVCADPTMLNATNPATNCLMGTPTGGIWKYDGVKWLPKTDIGEYGLGITEILRNPIDNTHLIASTGVSHTGDYGNSLGLLESHDNGDNWTDFGPMFPGFDPCETYIRGVYQNYDHLGNAYDLKLNFFIIVAKTGLPDQLWEWCAPHWILHTPTPYNEMVTNPSNSYGYYNPHLKLVDFTASANSTWLLTTESPFTADGGYLFHGTNNVNCTNSVTWIVNSSALPGYNPSTNQRLEISDSKNNIIFARSKGSNHTTLYRSIDGGLNWTTRTNLIKGGPKLDVEYSPTTGLVYLGELYMMVWDDVNMVLHQANGSTQHPDIRDFSILGINAAGQGVLFGANDGGVSSVVYDPVLATPNINAPGVFAHQPISGTSMPIQQLWGLGITQDCSGDYAIGTMHNNSFASVSGTDCKFGAGDGGDIEINPVDNNTVYFSINPSIRKGSLNSICNSYGTVIGTTSQWQLDSPLELHPNSPCLLFYGDDKSGSPSAELKIYNDCDFGSNPNVVPFTNVVDNTSGHVMQAIGAIGLTEAAPFQVFLGKRGFIDPAHSGKLLKIDQYDNSSFNWKDLSHNPVTNGGNQPFNIYTAWLWVGDIVVSPYDKDLIFVSMQGTSQGKRVFRSQDGGLTFEDWSDGLSDVPVNNLEYLYNSNDLVLAATDAGVYYRDNTMASWECFNEGHPLVWTTDIDVNYCKDEAWAATHGRGLFKTPLINLPRVARQHEITGNVVWNKDKVVYSDVVVKPGAVLTISSSLVKFGKDKRILVEAGGRLNVYLSELTALCEDSCWEGITVEGNTSLLQNNTNQGFAFISGSTLSHARSALNALGVTANFSTFDWNQMGGILTCHDALFLNNRRAVAYLAYENTDVSGATPINNIGSFNNCQFIINDDYRANCGSNEAFITMYDVDGVLITGCTFRDDRTSLSSIQDFRTGIGSGESTFRAIGTNVFEQLHRGINVDNVQEDNPFTLRVEDAVFREVETGIRLADVNNESHLLRNDIFIGHPLAGAAYGMVLHNSSGFTVEENQVQKQLGAGGFLRGFDILNTINTNNPGGSPFFGHNVIYNNIAINLSEGFMAWGNHVATNNQGLEFLCNQNIGNYVDFRINNCIQPTQGSFSSPAGNTFSCGGSISFDVQPLAFSCITYYYEQNISCNNNLPSFPGINFIGTSNSANCNYAPLSIDALTFDAQIQDKTAVLKWTTQQEMAIESYELQKSVEGVDFETIYQTEAKNGVSNRYEYKDGEIKASHLYLYRIKIIEEDGTVSFSPTRSVQLKGDHQIKFYPNPTTDELFLETHLPKNESVQFEISNLKGQIIHQENLELVSGLNVKNINVKNLPSGVYWIRLRGDRLNVIEKLLVIE